uniref:Cytochrome b n=1 Tax=Columbicola columbae TaxID=128991 RepID=A0A6G7SJX8_9NEOP|nr:cytochrome b [Columbicola columbae]
MYFKKNSLKLIRSEMVNIPTPSSISYFWNFGSLLGMCLMIQIVSGLFISFHYDSMSEFSFSSVVSLMNDVNWGWFLRLVHANGASLFFICLYLHVGRGLYFGSYVFWKTWFSGVTIILVLMMTAFLGYVLPWGQMSFWGATVITNLISTVPVVGDMLVVWLWGGFSVSSPTLTRFYSFHFILPFIVLGLVLLHLVLLHSHGSSNPLGLSLNSDKINFGPFFIFKDLLGFLVVVFSFLLVVLIFPDCFLDPDNFTQANPMVTPPHIQPEWYFLFAYAILRSIPSKLGGVVGLMMAILVLLPLSLIYTKKGVRFYPVSKVLFWVQVSNFLVLTFLGMMPVEFPFVEMGQIISFFYFLVYFFLV